MFLKKRVMILVLSSLALASCSHMEAKRRVASPDVGVIGGDGNVLLYYKEGDYIIVKNCEANTVLGSTPQQARANCEGKSNKVPVESFKFALRNQVSADRLNILKPLTPEEIEAYLKDGPSTSQIESMVLELDKINAFIKSYGAENANLVRKEELISALKSNYTKIRVIKKINAEIEKAIANIADQSSLTLTKYGNEKDQFLYTVLKNFDPTAIFPCGLTGTVDDRIKDCSYQESSTNGGFVLVTRTKEFKEVQKDTKSGLLWGDRLPTTMSYDDAMKACKANLAEVGGVVSGTWRLPTIEEYKDANINGIRTALPNMYDWWWSSSVGRDSWDEWDDFAWVFGGDDGDVSQDYYRVGSSYSRNDYAVRCVAR